MCLRLKPMHFRATHAVLKQKNYHNSPVTHFFMNIHKKTIYFMKYSIVVALLAADRTLALGLNAALCPGH